MTQVYVFSRPYLISYCYGLKRGVYLCIVSDSFNCGPAFDTVVMTEYPEIQLDVINILDNICYGDENGELDGFRAFAHDTGLTQDQANSILSLYGEMQEEQETAQKEGIDEYIISVTGNPYYDL